MSFKIHLLINDFLFMRQFCFACFLLKLLLQFVITINTCISALHNLLLSQTLDLKSSPSFTWDLLDQKYLKSSIKKVRPGFGICMINFMQKVYGSKIFDGLGIDFEQKICIQNIDLFHQHIMHGHLNRDWYIGLGPLILPLGFLYNNFRYGRHRAFTFLLSWAKI